MIVFAYGLALAWAWASWLLGPDARPHHFFTEGGSIDWLSTVFLAASALAAWSAWTATRRIRRAGAWFWLVSAAGLAALAADERFQIHEGAREHWLEPIFGAEALGDRNWNDLLVVAYGIVALAFFAAALPHVLRERRFRSFLAAGFGFYALHTIVDLSFPGSAVKDVAEETAKLLAGASFLLAYVQAARSKATTPAPIGRWHALALWAAVVALLCAFWAGGSQWSEMLARYWGPPASWVVSVQLGAAALLGWFAGPPRESRPGRAVAVWWGVLVALVAVLALGEAAHACQVSLRSIAPSVAGGVVHRPAWLLFTVATMAAIAIVPAGRRACRGSGEAPRLLALAGGLLVGLSLAHLFRPDIDGTLVGAVLRATAAGSVALSMLGFFLERGAARP